MNFSSSQKNKGFTLVEMMVSVAIFALVLVVVLGAIITIIDTNRKAQALSSVMNNLNFAVESMTRSVKTAVDVRGVGDTGDENSITVVDQFAYQDNDNKASGADTVSYYVKDGVLVKEKEGENEIPLTDPMVNITSFKIDPSHYMDKNDEHPLITFIISGTIDNVRIGETAFTIHTSVSSRNYEYLYGINP